MKPNATNAKHAILFIWIVLALNIAAFASSYMQYDFLKAVQSGARVTIEAAAANDRRVSTISILYLIAFIISAVFFLRWFKTAHHNLRQKTLVLRFSEGWVIGCWFVPFLNLVRPYQIMKELHIQTWSLLTSRNYKINATLTGKYLGLWWALWILNGIMGQVSLRVSTDAGEINGLIMATQAGMVASIIAISLALITIKVIKDYARVEPLLQQIDTPPPHRINNERNKSTWNEN
jgi:uncharacterized protein YhhL (DUF1145 family)